MDAVATQPHLCNGTHSPDETCPVCLSTPFERRFTELVRGLEELLDAAETAAEKYRDDPYISESEKTHLQQTAKVLEAAYLDIDLAADSLERFLIANELPIAKEVSA